jgi:hypothetical protein
MGMLRGTPVNAQVRYRGSFAPANFSLVTNEVAAALAKKFSEVFGLRSANIVFNQNAMSTQYVSFRYILPKEPIRYFDALIGVDQTEVVFSNPGSASQMKEECLKVWEAVIEATKPSIAEHHFEVTVHSTVEGTSTSVRDFLNGLVNVAKDRSDISRGFSLIVKEPQLTGAARIGLEVSTEIPDGLYLAFGCVSKTRVENMRALGELFDAVIKIYGDIQALAQIEMLESS